jgi:putative membrane protein insertion efficiency factor
MKRILSAIIKLYQYIISPMLGPSCRFTPTCSQYAHESIEEHGSLYGSVLAVRRLCRCHPGCQGGYDPVPKRRSNSDSDS